MKQKINLKSMWFNTKRAMYAAMVIVLALSIPTLSYMELSHTDKAVKSTEIVKNNNLKPAAFKFQKQS